MLTTVREPRLEDDPLNRVRSGIEDVLAFGHTGFGFAFERPAGRVGEITGGEYR